MIWRSSVPVAALVCVSASANNIPPRTSDAATVNIMTTAVNRVRLEEIAVRRPVVFHLQALIMVFPPLALMPSPLIPGSVWKLHIMLEA
jgi:hypothetical protein